MSLGIQTVSLLMALLRMTGEAAQVYRRISSDYRYTPIDKEASFRETNVIPDDFQVSVYLYKGQSQLYFYLLQQDISHLSLTVTPCTSVIEWAFRYRNTNDTGTVNLATNQQPPLWESRGQEMKTFTIKEANRGLYTLQVTSIDRESYVQFYMSTLYPGGHPALDLIRTAKMSFTTRRAKGELTVRWEPSAVDPFLMNYWLLVSTRPAYHSLCQARGEKYGVDPPDKPSLIYPQDPAYRAHIASRANTSRTGRKTPPTHKDTIVEFVGSKTSCIIRGLTPGKIYNFDLFAIISGTNLSFPYGSTTTKYHKAKPISLRDSKVASVNIRRLEGRANFRYKAKNNIGDRPVEWYVMPCGGGSLDAEIRFKDKIIVPRRRIEGYAVLTLQNPTPGARYILRLNVSDPEELSKISSVEVVGTMRGLPLPKMPVERRIHEYVSLQNCTSVTIGWLPILDPGPSPVRYCVRARELHAPWYSPTPDQCNLEATFNMLDYHVLQCQEVPPSNNRSVITEQVVNLKPGSAYELQVIVKKPKAKMLSYQILPIHTKPTC